MSNCETCGEEFETDERNSEFCSWECAGRHADTEESW